MDPGLLSLTLWADTLVVVVKSGQGNTIFINGNLSTLETTMHRLQAITEEEGTKDDAPAHVDTK